MGCGCSGESEISEKAERYVERPRKRILFTSFCKGTTLLPILESWKQNVRKASAEPDQDFYNPKRTNTTTTASTFHKAVVQNSPQAKPVVSTEGIKVDFSKFVTEGRGELRDRYREQATLGKGAYGEVKLMLDIITKEHRAMKAIPKENCPGLASSTLIGEIEVLKKLDHPNIIKLFEFYQDDSNYYLITEYCTGGELFDRIIKFKHFTEQKAAIIMKQLLSAVSYCHKLKIVHRDLKPENILFENPSKTSSLKIIDFGTARIFRKDKKMQQCLGTVSFFYIFIYLMLYVRNGKNLTRKNKGVLCGSRSSPQKLR